MGASQRARTVAGIAVIVTASRLALGNIDLEFRAAAPMARVGETVEIGLVAVSDDPEREQLFAAMQVIFTWNPEQLRFLGIDDTGGPPLLRSFLPFPDPNGINESEPPTDGDGLYVAWARLGDPLGAPPEGLLITTLRFEALAPISETPIGFLEEAGDPPLRTIVFDGEVPGLDVTGRLVGVSIEILPPCPADIDRSDEVSFDDLLLLLAAWGPCPPEDECPADINEDRDVGFDDLLQLLAAWGPCPEE